MKILAISKIALKDGTEDTLTRRAPAMLLFTADREGEDISQDVCIGATYAMLAAHALGLEGLCNFTRRVFFFGLIKAAQHLIA